MTLISHTIFGIEDKVKIAIDRLKQYEPPEGYYLAFSGGKDSCVIKQLAIESGVKFDAHYNVTTIDPPELVRFIRKYHPDVEFERPEKPFLRQLIEWSAPSAKVRWCCKLYKEAGGDNRVIITGLRWQESPRRRTWKMLTPLKKKLLFNPIIDWDAEDVWTYIKDRHLPYCVLYDEGWHRIGCIFCPMTGKNDKLRQLRRYPGYEKSFRWAFRKLWERVQRTELPWKDRWPSGDAMFDWWIHGESKPKDKETIDIFGDSRPR